jgi:hypothetical protein
VTRKAMNWAALFNLDLVVDRSGRPDKGAVSTVPPLIPSLREVDPTYMIDQRLSLLGKLFERDARMSPEGICPITKRRCPKAHSGCVLRCHYSVIRRDSTKLMTWGQWLRWLTNPNLPT